MASRDGSAVPTITFTPGRRGRIPSASREIGMEGLPPATQVELTSCLPGRLTRRE